jgi:hypothetical protein
MRNAPTLCTFTMLTDIQTDILFIFGDPQTYRPVYRNTDYIGDCKCIHHCNKGGKTIDEELV